jgi:hypothetical protein
MSLNTLVEIQLHWIVIGGPLALFAFYYIGRLSKESEIAEEMQEMRNELYRIKALALSRGIS